METLLKADIFFFVTTVIAIVLGVMLAVLLFYLIKAGRNLYSLSETIKDGVKESEEFIADLKDRFDTNMIFRLFFPRMRRKKPVSKEKNDAE